MSAQAIFISHASRDRLAASSLKDQLIEHGYPVVFVDFDPDGIPSGAVWERELYRLLRTCGAVIVLASRNAAASRWVKVLLVVRLDEEQPWPLLQDVQCVDAATDWDSAVVDLVQGLAAAGLDSRVLTSVNRKQGAEAFQSCFISYSSEDQNSADRLHADLTRAGVSCWFAPHDIRAGRTIYEQIRAAIHQHDRVLLILSPASITSDWVKTEILAAKEYERIEGKRRLFPLRLVDFETLKSWRCFDADTGLDHAQEIRAYFVPDFSQWQTASLYQSALDRLIRDLRVDTSQ